MDASSGADGSLRPFIESTAHGPHPAPRARRGRCHCVRRLGDGNDAPSKRDGACALPLHRGVPHQSQPRLGARRRAVPPPSECPLPIRTVDGGGHCTSVRAPVGLTSTRDIGSCDDNGTVHGPCVYRILFADAAHGYLWSLHSLYWTTNGGRSWQHLAQTHSHPWVGASALERVGNYVPPMMPVGQCSSGCIGRPMRARIGSGVWHDITPAQSGLYTSELDAQGATAYFLSGSNAEDPGRGLLPPTSARIGHGWLRIPARSNVATAWRGPGWRASM